MRQRYILTLILNFFERNPNFKNSLKDKIVKHTMLFYLFGVSIDHYEFFFFSI